MLLAEIWLRGHEHLSIAQCITSFFLKVRAITSRFRPLNPHLQYQEFSGNIVITVDGKKAVSQFGTLKGRWPLEMMGRSKCRTFIHVVADVTDFDKNSDSDESSTEC